MKGGSLFWDFGTLKLLARGIDLGRRGRIGKLIGLGLFGYFVHIKVQLYGASRLSQ